MRLLTPVFCLPVCLASITLAADSNHPVIAADPPSAQVTFVVGISPFLNSSAKDAVYRGLVRLMEEDLPLNTKLAVYDAYNLKSITSVSIPKAKVFDSPKTRANQFAASIGEVRQ